MGDTGLLAAQLASAVSGGVFEAGQAGYDEAVNIWNHAISRRPALVARCASAGDVATALRFGAEHQLEVSVRGGGHNYAGSALTDGGLMIDLTPIVVMSSLSGSSGELP